MKPAIHSFADKYLQGLPTLIGATPHPDTGVSIVIPSFKEPDLLHTIASLHHCLPTRTSIEVLVVFNASEHASKSIPEQHQQSKEALESFLKHNSRAHLSIHFLEHHQLPEKFAGVGLARKIGMDEAARRFKLLNKPEGVIICLDADCTVAENYLRVIESYFQDHPKQTSASIYFEHVLTDVSGKALKGITCYELFLRYYIEGLRWAQYPYSYHTVGSSMAVRAGTYTLQGGMNKRKAGEDFYFLHKLMPLGTYGEINDTIVYPSSRISDRVPFGTGRAMEQWMEQTDDIYQTYAPQIFFDLRELIQGIPKLYKGTPASLELPRSIDVFLYNQGIEQQLEEIRAHVSSAASFHQRFLRWLDGLTVLKYVHFARDFFYPNIPIEQAALQLLNAMEHKVADISTEGLLNHYRQWQKGSLEIK